MQIIDNILISKRIFSGDKKNKHFIGYIDNTKIELFSIILPKTSACVEKYDVGAKWMYFLIEGENLVKTYHNIWN